MAHASRFLSHPKLDHSDIAFRIAILLLPAVLLLINDNWIFSKPVSIDRWIYSGFHLHLPEFLSTFGHTYYASRLPWTLVGWVLHSMLDDVYALIALHFAVFYLAVFSLYATIRNLFANTVAAGAVAFAFGADPHFLHAAGWDYVDGATLSCIMAAFLALTSAAVRPRWRLAAVLWGGATCAMVSMYILVVLLVPIQIGMFLLLNRCRERRPVVEVIAFFVTGAAVTMLGFGFINWVLGGPFPYLLSQIRILTTVAGNRFRYDEPLSVWASQAYWLLVTTTSFLFSVVYVLFEVKSSVAKIYQRTSVVDARVSLFILCLGNAAASLLFISLQADHFYVLQMDYNADALLPFVYLPIGGALAVTFKALPARIYRDAATLAAIATIALVPWVLARIGIIPRGDLFGDLSLVAVWIAGGVLLLCFIVQRSTNSLGVMAIVCCLAFLNLGVPAGTATAPISYAPNPKYEAETLAVFDASRAVGPYNRDARARFWYNAKDPQAALLQDVVSSYLNAYSLVNDQFPTLISADGKRSSVAPGQRIMLLTSNDEDAVALANAAIVDQHLLFQQAARIDVRRSGVAFRIIVADVKGAMGPARTLPLETMRLASRGALLQRGTSGMAFRSLPDAWTYVGRIPLFAGCIEGGGWVAADIDVTHGLASVGVLNRKGDDFLVSGSAAASDKTQTVFLRLESFADAGDLLLRNGDEKASSDGSLEAVRIIADNGQTPAPCDPDPARTKAMAQARSLQVEAMTLAYKDAWLHPGPSGVMFRSSPDPWAYVGRMPLFADCLKGGGWIAADINVTRGTVGVGVLNRKGDDFLDSGSAVASDKVQTIFLRVAPFAAAGDFVVRNWDERTSSEGILKAVRIAVEDGQTPAACDPDSVRTKAMDQARALSLDTITLGSHGASLVPNASGVAFHSAPDAWSYIGRMPLLAECIQGGGWVAADIQVTRGTVGIGVLNRKGDDFLVSNPTTAGETIQTVFLGVASFAAAGDLVVRNWDERTSSEGILKAVRIAVEDGQTPAACDPASMRTKAMARARALSLNTITLGSHGASLLPSASGVAFHSAPDPWSYIGRMPLLAGCIQGGGWVAADLQVKRGTVGIGVLNREGDDFLVSAPAAAGDTIQTIFLRLASFAAAGDLIVRNWDTNSSAEGILKAVRIAPENGQSPATCDAGAR